MASNTTIKIDLEAIRSRTEILTGSTGVVQVIERDMNNLSARVGGRKNEDVIPEVPTRNLVDLIITSLQFVCGKQDKPNRIERG